MRLLAHLWNKVFYVLEFPVRYIWGRDIFISYSRRDTKDYPENLVVSLQDRVSDLVNQKKIPKGKLSFYLDKFIAPPSGKLPRSLIRHLRWSRMLVILCTEKAFAPDSKVTDEIDLFSKFGRKVILVNVDNVLSKIDLKKSPWKEISGAAPEDEGLENIETSTPSENVLVRILKSVEFTKQDERLKRSVWGTLLLVTLLLAGAASISYAVIDDAREDAKTKVKKANEDAERITKKANEDVAEAELKKDLANDKAEAANGLAVEKTKLADEKTKIAEDATDRAEEQTRLAIVAEGLRSEADREAVKQRSKAQATQLSSESIETLSQNNPQRLKDSLEISINAVRIAEENKLFISEPISSLRTVLKITPRKMANGSLSVDTDECLQSTFSANQSIFACKYNNQVKAIDLRDPEKPATVFEIGELMTDTIRVLALSVSDSGNRIAIALERCLKSGDSPSNSCRVRYEVVVKDRYNTFTQETSEANRVYLSPNGDRLVISEIKMEDLDEGEMVLKIWNIGKYEPQILNRERVKIVRGSDYSVDSPDYDKPPFAGNFSPNGRYFVAIGKHPTNPSVTVAYSYSVETASETYIPVINTINVEYNDSNRGIAINNTGDLIALTSNGISIWNISTFPKLESMIPTEVGFYSSIQFSASSAGERLLILDHEPGNISSQTFSVRSDNMGELCFNCDGDLNNVPFASVAYHDRGYRVSGFPFDHKELIGVIDNTKITIKRKRDDAVIDKIDTEENVLSYEISDEGTEVLVKTRTERSINDPTYSVVNRDNEYTYRKWKIGANYLIPIANKRIGCLGNATAESCR